MLKNFIPPISLTDKQVINKRSLHFEFSNIPPKHIFPRIRTRVLFNHLILDKFIVKILWVFNDFAIFPWKSMILMNLKDNGLILSKTPLCKIWYQIGVFYQREFNLKCYEKWKSLSKKFTPNKSWLENQKLKCVHS